MGILLSVVLVVVSGAHEAQAEEPRTFCGKTVDGWIEALRDDTRSIDEHRRAIWALGCFGAKATPARPTLLGLVQQRQLVGDVTEALSRIAEGMDARTSNSDKQLVDECCFHLEDMVSNGSSAFPASRLIRVGGPAVPVVLRVLNSPNATLSIGAADALGEIGPEARAAVPSLIRVIERSTDEEVVRHCAGALGRIGADARPSITVLNNLLSKYENIRYDVVIALDRLDAPPIANLLDRLIKEGDSTASFELCALRSPARRAAILPLRNALRDARPQVRIDAAVALAHVAPDAPETVPVLVRSSGVRFDVKSAAFSS